jgi:V8-like Glu-specific endopeptidase
MSSKRSSKKRRHGTKGPMTSKQLTKKAPSVPTHYPSDAKLPSHVAHMSVDSREGVPTVSTRLTEVASTNGKSVWRVDLMLGGAAVPPPRAEAARLSRPLRPSRQFSLKPSMPADGLLRVRPRLVPRPKRVAQPRKNATNPLRVFPPEGRSVYQDQTYPWCCVCRISSGGLGSGVLVGPRHVLTASHVLDWDNLTVSVDVNPFDGTSQATSGATKVWYYTKVPRTGTTTTIADEDFAVIVLSDRIGDRLGWMGIQVYDSGWDNQAWWRSIGYASDISSMSRPVYQRDFDLRLRDDDSDSFHTTITETGDFVPGQSGSPLFGFWDDGPYVVAVCHGDQTDGPNWSSNGSLIATLVSHARTEDP